MIIPRSGIVGTPESDRIVIDFEGGRFNPEHFSAYATRVQHAASRHGEPGNRYPTVARSLVSPSDLVEVGQYDPDTGEISIQAGREAELCRWLEVSVLDPDELRTHGTMRHEVRREIVAALASGDPNQIVLAREMQRRYSIELDAVTAAELTRER
jgi:hypothetical protein